MLLIKYAFFLVCFFFLLLNSNFFFFPTTQFGWAPMHSAARFGHEECILCLLKHGASLEVMDRKYRWTPLMRACISGNDEAVEALLKAGADPSARSKDGFTAKDYAIQRGFGPMGM